MSHGLATGAFAPRIVPIDPDEGLAAFGPEPAPPAPVPAGITSATPAAAIARTAVASSEAPDAPLNLRGWRAWRDARPGDDARHAALANAVTLPALPDWRGTAQLDEAPHRELAAAGSIMSALSAWRVPLAGRCSTACASASAGVFLGLTMAWVLLPQAPVAMEPQVLHIVPPAAAVVRADIVDATAVEPAIADVVRVSASVEAPQRAVPAPAVAARPRPAAPPVPAPPAPGWLSVSSPFPVRVFVDGTEVGSSGAGRLTVAPGAVSVRLVNEALEFDELHDVTVASRRGSSLSVNAPNGVLHVNARPWASVWVDGRLAGETPVGNIVVPVGTHDVVLRHPQLGEQRVAVSVGARTPARVSVEFQP